MHKNFLALIFVLFLISIIFLTQNALAGSATVAWNANTESDLLGYKIYYGTSPRSGSCPSGGYPNVLDVGNVTSYTFNNLTDGSTYYFSVTAYDTTRNESTCSTEVSKPITAAGTLTVSLTAAPSSGNVPLNGVELAATVGGTATGNINYTFYCNRSDSGINITTPYDAKYDNQSVTLKTATGICSYASQGTYTAKIIAERGGSQAESRTTITVGQSSNKFQIGDTIYVSSGPLNVRATASASGTLLGAQATNAQGTVAGGPTYSDGYWWWQINYNNVPSGWSIENYLEKYIPAAITNINFIPSSESITNLSVAGKQFTITIFRAGSQVATFTGAPNAQGQIPLPTSITNLVPGNYDIYSDADQCLKGKIANVALSSGAVITLPTLKSGDLNDDGVINSLDWSSMNGNWFTANPTADLNRDGVVNSLDFSWMNKNWLQTDAI